MSKKDKRQKSLMKVGRGSPTHQTRFTGAGWLLQLLVLFACLPASQACTTMWNQSLDSFLTTSPVVPKEDLLAWAPLVETRPWTLPWGDHLQPSSCFCAAEWQNSCWAAGSGLATTHAAAEWCNLCNAKLHVVSWDGFKVLVVRPVVELNPWSVEDPLFNWVWLFCWGFFVVNIRFGLNHLIQVYITGKKRKKPKKTIKHRGYPLTSQPQPVAFGARFCKKRRMRQARMRYRRLARSLAFQSICSRVGRVKTGRQISRLGLFPPLRKLEVDVADSQYQTWMKEHCQDLSGGAGGAAATRRSRKQKAEGGQNVASLVQLFKEFVNRSGGLDLAPLATLLDQFQAGSQRKKKKKTKPKPPPTAVSEFREWKGHRYRVCPDTGWWTWVGPSEHAHTQVDSDASWNENWPALPKSQPQTRKVVSAALRRTQSPVSREVTGIRSQDWHEQSYRSLECLW